jgi:hypothetical protein
MLVVWIFRKGFDLQNGDMIGRVLATIGARNLAMRTYSPALITMALVGLCSHAYAQARCPELLKLRSEAAEAVKQMTSFPTLGQCEAHSRFSMAWGEIVRYANEHRELCNISSGTLSEFEKRHREAVRARDDVCTSRPPQPFPPDIIRR